MLQSISLISPRSIAAVKVDKATSELLISPDWTLNMEICDVVNSSQWVAKEVIKAMKKRLQHKNSKVQMLTLTLLETAVKNCDDRIHFHIAERKILDEMLKIIKKRGDMQVRLKILVLVDSWQEAFGGLVGKHIHYYLAYNELKRYGVQFPQRSFATPPIITPPATQLSIRDSRVRPGMHTDSSRNLDDTKSHDAKYLSTSCLETIHNALELLADMLQAVNPNDQMLLKDEVIVDLVDECRTNQGKLMQMVTNTTDEQLLRQCIELNDKLQILLKKHDAIASGTTLSRDKMKGRAIKYVEEQEDEPTQLARRGSRSSHGIIKSEPSSNSVDSTFSASATVKSRPDNALVPVDLPNPIKTTKEQDMVDFLSLVLSTSFSSEAELNNKRPYPTQNCSRTHNYVTPWAQNRDYTMSNTQDNKSSTMQINPQDNTLGKNIETSKLASMRQEQTYLPSQQSLVQPCHPQSTSAYTLPPRTLATSNPNNQISSTAQYRFPTAQEAKHISTPMQSTLQSYAHQNKPLVNTRFHSLQQSISIPCPQSKKFMGNYSLQQGLNTPPVSMDVRSLQCMSSMISRGDHCGDASSLIMSRSTITSSPKGQNPYIPPHRLFEDLNVFGKIEGKTRSGPNPSASYSSLVDARR